MVPWACHQEDGVPGRDALIEAQVARTEHDGCQEARRAPELRHSHRVVPNRNCRCLLKLSLEKMYYRNMSLFFEVFS